MSYLTPVTSPQSARAFLARLESAGLMFHPEESAADCLAHHCLPFGDVLRIESNMRACFDHLPDPCAVALELKGGL